MKIVLKFTETIHTGCALHFRLSLLAHIQNNLYDNKRTEKRHQ